MRKRLALAATALSSVLFLQACGRALNPEKPCNFVQNGALQRVSWAGRLPVKMYIHQSVSNPDHIDAIKSAARIWNEAMKTRGIPQAISIEASYVAGELRARRDGYSMIYLRSDWDPDQPTEQARTTVHWSGDRLYEADVQLNGRNFRFFIGSQRDFTAVHLESLMVHEFGHVLGLAHTATSGSVMVTTLSQGQIRNKVPAQDLESLACEY